MHFVLLWQRKRTCQTFFSMIWWFTCHRFYEKPCSLTLIQAIYDIGNNFWNKSNWSRKRICQTFSVWYDGSRVTDYNKSLALWHWFRQSLILAIISKINQIDRGFTDTRSSLPLMFFIFWWGSLPLMLISAWGDVNHNYYIRISFFEW